MLLSKSAGEYDSQRHMITAIRSPCSTREAAITYMAYIVHTRMHPWWFSTENGVLSDETRNLSPKTKLTSWVGRVGGSGGAWRGRLHHRALCNTVTRHSPALRGYHAWHPASSGASIRATLPSFSENEGCDNDVSTIIQFGVPPNVLEASLSVSPQDVQAALRT